MAKQLNVNLAFNADTSSAIKNLNELNTALSKLGSIDIKSNSLSAEMKQAAASAQELQMHLSRAYDSKLGNLNLGKFEQSLKSSNTSLAKLSTDLLGAGRNGEQAFLKLQSSIASANTQLVQSKGLLAEFATTLKNTARWQLSSSVLHGFMGAIQSAYGYSQRLNESLNNIRIVTGYNVERMAEFANQANKAAKALSTTTTDYTNASLIYYQQGLSDSEVQARTDVTVKMANVANKTASEVSEQMTAVWNNFYDGSKSLEYYADVMTALGAATASSTDEIAGGLEKFAAVGQTIGLSYEYAAAALATITSNTRQSEEVVGTALKTIFARIQGLNLGETLDDGTTLNKYSQALQKVGISIFDAAGNLKDMDNILDEMGNKWDNLNKAQQVALAQTVAGTRQYTQLVALMDNWNKGDSDSFQTNLNTAYNAEGALAEQHAIYEEGWEAAQKRVKAGWEAIYKELVPDEAFINLYNGFAKILDVVEALVKTVGGLEGILMLAASVMANKFAPAIGEAFNNGLQKIVLFKNNVKDMFKGSGSLFSVAQAARFDQKEIKQNPNVSNPYSRLQESTAQMAANLKLGTTELQKQQMESLQMAAAQELVTAGFKSRVDSLKETTELTNIIKANANNLSKATAEDLMAQVRKTQELGEQKALLVQQKADIQNQIEMLKENKSAEGLSTNVRVNNNITTLNTGVNSALIDEKYLQSVSKGVLELTTGANNLGQIINKTAEGFVYMDDASSQVLSDIIEMNRIMQVVDSVALDDNYTLAADAVNKLKEDLKVSGNLTQELQDKINAAFTAFETDGDLKAFQANIANIVKTTSHMGRAFRLSADEIKNAQNYGRSLAKVTIEGDEAARSYANSWTQVQNNVHTALKNSLNIIPTLARGFSTLSSTAMSINMVSNAIDTLSDSSASWTQKLSSGLMAISMAFQSVMNVSNLFKNGMAAINGLVAVQNSQLAINAVAKMASANASKQVSAASAQEAIGSIAVAAAKELEKETDEKLVLSQIKEGLQQKLNIAGDEAEALSNTILNGIKSQGIGIISKSSDAKAGELAMTNANTKANWKEVASLAARHWILLLTIAVIAILAAGFVAAANAEKKRIEANKESAKQSREAAEAAKQEAEANRDLVNSYYEALEAYQKTGEGKQECIDAAIKAAEAYGIEGAEILILAGKYEELNKLIREKQALEAKEAKKKTDTAINDTRQALVDSIRTGDGHLSTGNSYVGDFNSGWDTGDETAAYQALNNGGYKFLSKNNSTGNIDFGITDSTNSDEVFAYFQELERFLEEQRQIAAEQKIDLGASEVYQAALKEFQEGQEQYNELKALRADSEQLDYANHAYETKALKSGKGLGEISTLEEYEDYEEQYLQKYKDIMSAKGIEEGSEEWNTQIKAARNYLGTLSEIKQFYNESKGFESLQEKGLKEDETKKIKEWYDTLSEDDKALFWQVDIDENSSLESVKSAMEVLQQYADGNQLVASIRVAADVESLLSADTKDWTKIKDKMTALWNSKGFSPEEIESAWLEFLGLNDEERIRYVQNVKKDAFAVTATTTSTNIAGTEDDYYGEEDPETGVRSGGKKKAAEEATKKVRGIEGDLRDDAKDLIDARNAYRGVVNPWKGALAYTANTKKEYDAGLIGGQKWVDLFTNVEAQGEGFIDPNSRQYEFLQGMSNGNLAAFAAGITKDDQMAMQVLKGTGLVYQNEDGSLRWSDEFVFDSQGNMTAESQTKYLDHANIRGDYFAAGKYALDSAVVHNDKVMEAQSVYDTTSDDLKAAKRTAAGAELKETASYEAYENALKAQAEWDDSFEADNEKMDLDAEEVNEYANNLLELAENGELVDESLTDNVNGAKLMAQGISRMNKGVKDLSENWKDQSAILSDSSKILTSEYANAMKSTRSQIEDILDLDLSGFEDSWFTSAENMKLFERIARGDLKAIDELRMSAAKKIVVQIAGDNEGLKTDLDNILATAQTELPTLKVGATLDSTQFGQALLAMVDSAQITADEANRILASVGFEPQVTYLEVPASQASYDAQTSTYTFKDPITGEMRTAKVASQIATGTNGMIRIPIINGSKTTYKGMGGATASPPKTNNNGGGGSKDHAEKKSDSDKTRYHTLQNQLEDLKSQYDEISKAKDNAFGAKKLALMDDEITKTDELIAKQEEYLNAIEENLPKDRAIMDAYYDKTIGGPTIEYDENGNIANYDAIQDAMYAKYNEMADKYTSDSEEWKVFEKQYEQMEKYIEQYEETYDLLRDEEAEYQELLRQRMDQELEKIQYQIELKLNIAEDSLALLEHQLERIDDDASKAAEAIGLFSEKAESLYDQMQADREGLNDILGQHLSEAEIKMFYDGDMSVLQNKDFTENQIAAIKEYRDNLLDLNSEMMAIRDSVQEQLMEVFDDWNEKLEAGTQTLEHYGSVLESYKNIIDVVGKDTLGLSDEFMSDLGQAQVSNAIDQVNASRDVYESMVNAQREAEQALEQARANGDTESIKYWEDTLASITENAQSAQEELLDSWEAALSAIADQFETTVQTLIDNFNDSVYSLGGLEGLSEDFSRQKENADMMLDDYQKIYELSKLSRDINGKLDDTKIIAGKQKLRDLLEKINDLQEDGVEMSQYDLEYLQKEYDLRLAEIELEEAQRAKNTVRMSRDNEGNWSYVYTQNTDAVDSAQQKYEDALYAMQDLSSNYIDEMSEQLIATSQEMQEALAAIRIEDYASIEEYYAEVERVQKQYQDELAMQEAELNKAVSNNKTLYEEDWTNYHNITGYKISDTQDFATAFKDTMLGTLMGSEEDTSNFTSIIGSAVSSLTTGLMEAAQVYYTNLNSAMEAAGTSTENFAEDTAANIDAVVAKSQEGAAAVDQMAEEMDEAFSAITETITAWQETYGLAMQEIIDSNIAVVESFNAMLEALSIDAGKITVNYDINTTPDGVDPAAFDTGGYTGKWGDAGKLAVLHEKELILNQDDTEKFMKAMAYSKMILETIDLNAKYASMGMGEIVPTVIKEEAPQTLEQMVHITAEFPGVNDHYEIEEAFNNLINKASQYANRKL